MTTASDTRPSGRILNYLLTAAMLACFVTAGWHFAGNHVSEAATRSHDEVVPASLSDSLQTAKSDDKSPKYVTRNIEDLKPGDLVLAREEHGNSIEYRPIKEVYRRTSYHLRHLTFETNNGKQQTLQTTDEHPFWSVTDRAWIDAGDLKPGTQVTSPTGAIQTLAATRRTNHPEGIPVFNFQVKDFHTYFVAESSNVNPLLAHNASCVEANVDFIKNAKGKGNNITVKNQKEAEELINKARPEIPLSQTYAKPKQKIGWEVHGVDGSGNAPGFDHELPHIKWKDWTKGKIDGAEGHIYFEGLL